MPDSPFVYPRRVAFGDCDPARIFYAPRAIEYAVEAAEAWSEVGVATADLEGALRATFDHQKINYLALMMVDPHVHFHVIPRYSTTRDWSVPHFEKMLYDNAQLVRIYLDGWRLTKDERFRHVVDETLEYVRREMTHPDGAFFAAQDADSEGHEGAFFVWTPVEIMAVLGAELGGEFCRFYGVTEDGNFEGKNVLHRLSGLELSAEEQEVAESTLRPARAKLLAARERRVKPLRDENILTSWNAMMVSAFLDAAVTFSVPAYRAAAEQALTYLLDYAVLNGRVCRTVVGGKGRLNGYLDDAAWLATALLDAFEATSHRWYLDQACAVTESLLTHFWDETAGGCFYTSHDHERLIQRMKSGTDSAVPSGNAVAASLFLSLFSFTGEGRYYERADQILRLFQSVMKENPYSASAMLCSVDWFLSGPKEIVVVGARGSALTEAMVATGYQRYVPNRALLTVEDPRPVGEAELLVDEGELPVAELPLLLRADLGGHVVEWGAALFDTLHSRLSDLEDDVGQEDRVAGAGINGKRRAVIHDRLVELVEPL